MQLRKTRPGRYYAVAGSHTYLAVKQGRIWHLKIAHSKRITGGVSGVLAVTVTDPDRPPAHQAVYETLTECRAIAQEFHALGDDYQPHKHGHRSRHTEAIRRAYARLAARDR